MIVEPCKLERFFAPWEFRVEHVACASDVDGYPLGEFLRLADPETAELWDGMRLGYTETAGHPALRQAIAAQYAGIDPDEVVVCGGGAAEALFLVGNALGPGDHAVVIWPAFEALAKVPVAAGAEVTFVPLDEASGWALDLDLLSDAVRPDTRAVFVNFPHNPTGALPPVSDFRALVSLAGGRGAVVVSDEVYRYLEFDEGDRLPPAADLDERAVSVGVLSKAYGLAGLRIGWIVSHDEALLQRVVALKDYTSVCAAAPSEVLGLIALRAREEVVGRARGIVAANLAHVDGFFERWAGLLEWVRPKGGTVAFPRLEASMPVDDFVAAVAEKESVLLLPGTVFDDTRNHFRLGLGRSGLPEAIDRLDSFLVRTFGRG